jgi:hypothetical protein
MIEVVASNGENEMAVIGMKRSSSTGSEDKEAGLVLQSVGLFSKFWLGITMAAGRGAESFVKGALSVTNETFNEVSRLTGLKGGAPTER